MAELFAGREEWQSETIPTTTNHLNMRIVLLQNLCNYYATERAPSRSLMHSLQKNRAYLVSRPDDALDAVRAVFQKSLNKEIDAIIRKFSEKYLVPAVANIQTNGYEVSETDMHSVYCRILEEAKHMYLPSNVLAIENNVIPAGGTTTVDRVGTPSMIGHPAPTKIVNRHIPAGLRKRKEGADSDTESDVSQVSSGFRKKVKAESGYGVPKRTPAVPQAAANTSKSLDIPIEDAEKWNPNRVDENTIFVLGSKANSALGLSAQRGRIYIKHPGLFRYIGDHEDKMWLFENKQKTVKFGGKAFLVVLDDIVQLAETPEYRSNPDVQVEVLNGFTLPPFIIDKIRAKMEPVYETLRARYGLTSTSTKSAAPDQPTVDVDDQQPNVQESPVAPSDGGSDV